MNESHMTMLIDGVCVALIYRFGLGDQVKASEYMPNNDGTYFDNEGRDSTKFENKDHVIRVLKKRFPDISEKEI